MDNDRSTRVRVKRENVGEAVHLTRDSEEKTLRDAQAWIIVGATFVSLVMTSTVASLDFSSWYAGRALFPAAIMIAILVYGAATALAGKAIFGDPLREGPGR